MNRQKVLCALIKVPIFFNFYFTIFTEEVLISLLSTIYNRYNFHEKNLRFLRNDESGRGLMSVNPRPYQ